jgi:Rrf2 family protein
MLSRSAAYAVSALTYLASRSNGEWTLCREISDALSLPPQYLARILRVLSARRLLQSQRGRNGGFRLAMPASEISLFQIIDPFDFVVTPRECFFGMGRCTLNEPCPMHEKWKPIGDAFVGLLQNTVLADVANDFGPLQFVRADGRTRRR